MATDARRNKKERTRDEDDEEGAVYKDHHLQRVLVGFDNVLSSSYGLAVPNPLSLRPPTDIRCLLLRLR